MSTPELRDKINSCFWNGYTGYIPYEKLINLIETAKAEARREFAEEVQECLQNKRGEHLLTLENRNSMQLLRVGNKVREVLTTLNSKEE